jgi:hypothetical protein
MAERQARRPSRAAIVLRNFPGAGDGSARRRNRSAVKRILSIVALGTLSLLAACKEPPAANAPSNLITSAPDIVIKSLQIVAAPENSVQGDTLYIVTFTFTNDVGRDFVPRIDHFTLQDKDQIRHTGITSGSTALAGRLHNSDEILHKNESRDYMAAFLVYSGTFGTLSYALDF